MKKVLLALQLFFVFIANAQDLSIINTGQTGTSGTNWSLTDNGTLVTITVTGAANINPSVISDKLNLGRNVVVNGSGASIWVKNNITYSGSAVNRLTLKTVGFIAMLDNTKIESTSGALDVILWADTDNSQSAGQGNNDEINILAGCSIITNGGKIVLAGGLDDGANYGGIANDGIPDNYAYRGAGDLGGVNLGPASGTGTVVSLLSSGGDIAVRGYSYWSYTNSKSGIVTQANLKIDAGAGRINLEGISGVGNGIEFTWGATPNIAITSSYSGANPAIRIAGGTRNAGSIGIFLANVNSGNILIQSTSTTGGGIVLAGSSMNGNAYTAIQTTPDGSNMNLQLLSGKGDIVLQNEVIGSITPAQGYIRNYGVVQYGARANTTAVQGVTPAVTSSTANVVLSGTGAFFDGTKMSNAATTGSFSVLPRSADAAFVTTTTFKNVDLTTVNNFKLGKVGNTQEVIIATDITVNGPISLYGGSFQNIQVNANITSTAAGDILFQGDNSTGWTARLALGKTIAKTAGTGNLIVRGTGRITFDGAITASGTGKLNVVMVAETDGGTTYGVGTGAITTNGGHVWIGGGAMTNKWNGLDVGAGAAFGAGGGNNDAIYLQGDISTSGGDVLLSGYTGDGVNYGDIVAWGGARTIDVGNGDVTLLTKNGDFTGPNNINIQTTGILSIAPNSSTQNWSGIFDWAGTVATDFTGTLNSAKLVVKNIANLTGLNVGIYPGTGLAGDVGYPVVSTGGVNSAAPTTINGPINLVSGTITINGNLISTAAGAAITAKSTNYISINSGRSFQTNNGNFIMWSDSDNSGGGYITLGDNTVINTVNGLTTSGLSSGGKIVLAGGLDNGANGGVANDSIPDGVASNSAGVGLTLGSTTANYTQLYSGGGDIILRGTSSYASATPGGMGFYQWGRWTANSGKGAITINGNSTSFYGINFTEPASNVTTGNKHLQLISDKTSGDAISITGTSNGSYGIVFNYNNPKEILATGGGNITVNGTGGAGSFGIFLQNQDILASTGLITLNGGTKGITVKNVGTRLGGRSGADIVNSSSNVKLIADVLSFDALTTGFTDSIKTSGTVTIEPYSNSFTSALNYPITNLSLSSNVSALTVGKLSNTANITFGSATSIAGPITAYGGTVALNATVASTATTGTGISINGQRINQADGISVTTQGANIEYLALNAPSYASTAGNYLIYLSPNGATKSTINANGGNINLSASFGATGTGAQYDRAIFTRYSDIITKGSGTITITGDATNSIATNNVFGVHLKFTTVKTEMGAINITGTAGKTSTDSRGIYIDGAPTNIVSNSGAITIIDKKPAGLTGTYNGLYSKPWTTEVAHMNIGADGTIVTSSSSPVTIQSDKAEFIVGGSGNAYLTKVNTSGAVVLESNAAAAFEANPTLTGLNILGTPSSVRIGKTTNTANITLGSAISAAGPITVYGGNIALNGNINSSAGNINGDVLLKATADITMGASKSITTSGGDVIMWANADGQTSNGGVFFDQSSSVTTAGGHIWIGGGSGTITWNGLSVGDGYAVSGTNLIGLLTRTSSKVDWESGVFLDETTLNSGGGNIYIAGQRNTRSNQEGGAGIINYNGLNGTTIDAGTGLIEIKGDGRLAANITFGFMTGLHPGEASGSFTIKSANATQANAISIQATNATTDFAGLLVEDDTYLLSTANTNGGGISVTGTSAGNNYGIWTQVGSLNVLSASGPIKIDAGTKGIGLHVNSSFTNTLGQTISNTGHLYVGRRAGSAVTSSTANIEILSDKFVTNTGSTINAASTGTLSVLSKSGTFSEAINTAQWNLASDLSVFTLGKTSNTQNITLGSATSIAGPISVYGGTITLGIGVNLTSTSPTGNINLLATNGFSTAANSGTTRGKIMTAGGDITIKADADNNNSGLLDIDWLTIDGSTGNILVEGSSWTWSTASGVTYPEFYGSGGFTYRTASNSTTAFNTTWLALYGNWSSFNIGQPGNTADVVISPCANCYSNAYNYTGKTLAVAGPINLDGGSVTIGQALTATNSTMLIGAKTAVTQTAAIKGDKLGLKGNGSFTLNNIANNFATIAAGEPTAKIGNLNFKDSSGGIIIGSVNPSGITSTGTVLIETEIGNITLADSINTTSTSTDAIILNAGKSKSIGDPTGGDIIVSGTPKIAMGTVGIAKFYSGSAPNSTGLTAFADGTGNVREGVDETTVTYNPVLSANNKYALYRFGESNLGSINIVSSGGAAINNGWEYVNDTIRTTSGTGVSINASVIQNYLATKSIAIRAGSITFSANINSTTANNISFLSNTHISNTVATTITTQGGKVVLASNVDDATDNESTTNGYHQMRNGLTITTNGGDITMGGGNLSGTGYAMGSSAEDYTEGVRIDGVLNINSGGGNILIRGKSYARAVQSGWGASGVGLYFLSATGNINSGTGTITIDGYSQTTTSSYASGIYSGSNINITSANTTANAIKLIGKATGTSGQAWGIETENTFSVIATGTGGGITISTSQQNSGDSYDAVFRGETNILAKSGPIKLLGGQDGGIANGRWYIASNNTFFGSKASSDVTSSSSDIELVYDLYVFDNAARPKINTSGKFSLKPTLTSFGQGISTSWFLFNQNSQIISEFTFGKPGNNTTITHETNAVTVAGPISIYGGQLSINANLTSSATGDIFIKSLSSANSSIYVNTGVTIGKTGGTGTLTMQAQGRINNSGSIIATSPGVLNTVLWSDFDNSNNDGGVGAVGNITTNGGHVWVGGSSSNGGTYKWKGLTVGDGPAIGSFNNNYNALDYTGVITTNGGEVLLWGGDGYGGGTNGIAASSPGAINAGSGNVTLISDVTTGTLPITTTGKLTLLPNGGAYASATTLTGSITGTDLGFTAAPYNGLTLKNIANLGGLYVGQYSGMTDTSSNPIVLGNTSFITNEAPISIAGPIAFYGYNIINRNSLTTTLPGAAILQKAIGTIISLPNHKFQTNNGDITFWANSNGAAGASVDAFIGFNSGVQVNSANGSTTQLTGGGTITLAGGTTTTTLASGTVVPTGYAYSSITTNWGSERPCGIQLGAYKWDYNSGNYANDIKFYSGGG